MRTIPKRGKLRSCGLPVPTGPDPRGRCEDSDVPTGEVGEFVIQGQKPMKGYWNKPEATAASIAMAGFIPAMPGSSTRTAFSTYTTA
jgi:long-subunit acyl-CoA synthetase (AMP-forming)